MEKLTGFADIVYLPRPEYLSVVPALIIELKWNKNTETALTQIHEKNYPSSISEYTVTLILVGINYDKKTKTHECEIETVEVGE